MSTTSATNTLLNKFKSAFSWASPGGSHRKGMSAKQLALRSLVGHNLTINGDMTVDEFGLRIDGHIVGNVHSENGLVMVGAGGSVMGSIRAARIIVAGKVVGNLVAQDVIECTSTAQVQGHTSSAGFMIHAGAIVRGTMAATEAQVAQVLAATCANDDKHHANHQRHYQQAQRTRAVAMG